MTLHRKLFVSLISLVAAGVITTAAWAAAPSNTTTPTITGTPKKGMTLTAHHNEWTNNPTSFTYRWQRCGADGTGCAGIGATGKTYTLVAADVDHTVRVRVTAANADGSSTAFSKPTDVISDNNGPTNTTKPTITGTPMPGEELTASNGTWTGGATSFAYQWQRCDTAGAGCADVVGATGKTYGVRAADVGHTLRVQVTAKNASGSTTATSDVTAAVHTASTPSPAQSAANRRPTVAIIGARFAGRRLFVRMRVCDDSRRNVKIRERDSKPHVLSYVRNFRTLAPPRNCAALTRSWFPAPRFRHGRYTVTLMARDAHGLWSLRAARRTFFR
jgi:hypothetical protein